MIVIKSNREIEGIRKSSQLAANALRYAGTLVKPGVTTESINDAVHAFIESAGGSSACLNYNGFPKSICTSVNDVVCHGIPSSLSLNDGDIIKIDVTTILGGFFGDCCATYPVGEIKLDVANLIAVTRHCLDIGVEQVKPGVRLGKIGFEINQYAMSKGYSVVYDFCGHGTGLSFHEEPQVMHISLPEAGAVMMPGMIFTIEPMINVGLPAVDIDKGDRWTVRTRDGRLSAQFEHTVLVTELGCEVLTKPTSDVYAV